MTLDKTKICFSLEKSRTFYRLQEIKAGINRTQKKRARQLEPCPLKKFRNIFFYKIRNYFFFFLWRFLRRRFLRLCVAILCLLRFFPQGILLVFKKLKNQFILIGN